MIHGKGLGIFVIYHLAQNIQYKRKIWIYEI